MVSIAYIYFLKKLDLHPQLMQSSSTEIADQVLKPAIEISLECQTVCVGAAKIGHPTQTVWHTRLY